MWFIVYLVCLVFGVAGLTFDKAGSTLFFLDIVIIVMSVLLICREARKYG